MAEHNLLSFFKLTVYLSGKDKIFSVTNLVCGKGNFTCNGKIGSGLSDLYIGGYDLGKVNEHLCGNRFFTKLRVASLSANIIIRSESRQVNILLAACNYLGVLVFCFRFNCGCKYGNYTLFFTFCYKSSKFFRM